MSRIINKYGEINKYKNMKEEYIISELYKLNENRYACFSDKSFGNTVISLEDNLKFLKLLNELKLTKFDPNKLDISFMCYDDVYDKNISSKAICKVFYKNILLSTILLNDTRFTINYNSIIQSNIETINNHNSLNNKSNLSLTTSFEHLEYAIEHIDNLRSEIMDFWIS